MAKLRTEDMIALLRRESALVAGYPPGELAGIAVRQGRWVLHGNEYLLRTDRDLRFHYRRGAGVRSAVPPDCTSAEIELWRNGSIYSAIAAINGLMPVHASAVAHNGGLTAFTGPTGAGKSTLVAALTTLGLPMFCDDTLVLDLDPAGPVTGLPGHRRLKLTEEALAATGAARQEPVAPDVEKYYARPATAVVDRPLPLRRLIFLEHGPRFALIPIAGTARLLRLEDDHYTTALHAAALGHDRASIFAARGRLAREVEMFALVRPHDPAQIMASARLVAAELFETA